MKLCSEFHVAPEGIKGYGFCYCSIECWPKCMNIIGLCTVYTVIMQSWVVGGLFSCPIMLIGIMKLF